MPAFLLGVLRGAGIRDRLWGLGCRPGVGDGGGGQGSGGGDACLGARVLDPCPGTCRNPNVRSKETGVPVGAVAPQSWLWSRGLAEPQTAPALLQAWSLDWWQPRPVGAATVLGTEVTPGGGSPDRFLWEHLGPQSRLCPTLGEAMPPAGSRVWGPGSRPRGRGQEVPSLGLGWGRGRGRTAGGQRGQGGLADACSFGLPTCVGALCSDPRQRRLPETPFRPGPARCRRSYGVGEPGWHPHPSCCDSECPQECVGRVLRSWGWLELQGHLLPVTGRLGRTPSLGWFQQRACAPGVGCGGPGLWPGRRLCCVADPSRSRTPPQTDSGAEAWNFPGDAARCKAGRRVLGVGLDGDLLGGPWTPEAPPLWQHAPRVGERRRHPHSPRAVRDSGPASRPRAAGHAAQGSETASSLGHLGW